MEDVDFIRLALRRDFDWTMWAKGINELLDEEPRIAEAWMASHHEPGKLELEARQFSQSLPRLRLFLRQRPPPWPKNTVYLLMNRAIEFGMLRPAPACAACRSDKIVSGHHRDYSRPLRVDWLCARCHGRLHSHQKARETGALAPWLQGL